MRLSTETLMSETHALQRDGVIIAFRPRRNEIEVPPLHAVYTILTRFLQ